MKNRNCSRNWSAQAQMSKPMRNMPKTSQLAATYDMQCHAQKCVERYCEWAHKTSDQLHNVSNSLSETCSQFVLKCLFLARVGRQDLLWTGQISHIVEQSMRPSMGTSHHLHSSHNELQTVLSRWKSSNRLQAGIIPRRRFCRKSQRLKINIRERSVHVGISCVCAKFMGL